MFGPKKVDTSRWPRRRLLRGTLLLGGAFGGGVLGGCQHRGETCPPEQLAPEDAQQRETFKYTDRSLDATKQCQNCQQYLPRPGADCGGCKLLKGPIHPAGSCVAFAAKT
jgi:hypothetical protein